MPRRLFRRKRRPAGVGSQTDARAFAIRHRFVLVILLAQVPLLAAVGLASGVSVYEAVVASLLLITMGVIGMSARNPGFAAGAVALGLIIAAGTLVRFLDGTPESSFAFFLAIVVISFYRDRRALILGFVYVAAYHLIAAVVPYRDTLLATQDETTTVAWPVLHLALTVVLVLVLMTGWRLAARVENRRGPGEDSFRFSFETAPLGMAVLTPAGEFIHVNRALADVLGHEPGHLVGANVRSVVHSYDLDILGQSWKEMARRSDEMVTSWMRCTTPDGGEIWARLDLTFSPGVKNRPAMVLLHLKDAGEEYEQQQRFEAMIRHRDEYLATVAEELRAPIGAVLDLTGQEPPALEIASVVEDLIVSARGDTVPVSVVAGAIDAGEMLEETLESMPGQIPVQIEATSLWADPGLTRRILHSLVNNAIRYGGSRVEVKTVNSGPDTVIQVIDDGPEVPASERERIFNGDLRCGQPVTKPAAVGLSLTVARHLARQMDGDIAYRRTQDGRNIFELRLPSEPVRAGVEPLNDLSRIPA